MCSGGCTFDATIKIDIKLTKDAANPKAALLIEHKETKKSSR